MQGVWAHPTRPSPRATAPFPTQPPSGWPPHQSLSHSRTLPSPLQMGATFGKIQEVLVKQHSRVTVAGQQSTIGPGGCLGGGCHGPLSRLHGLGADNVISYTLVTPQGQLVRASNEGLHKASLTAAGDVSPAKGDLITQDASLFWAMRGGGGGRWGVVLQVGRCRRGAPVGRARVEEGITITGTRAVRCVRAHGRWGRVHAGAWCCM